MKIYSSLRPAGFWCHIRKCLQQISHFTQYGSVTTQGTYDVIALQRSPPDPHDRPISRGRRLAWALPCATARRRLSTVGRMLFFLGNLVQGIKFQAGRKIAISALGSAAMDVGRGQGLCPAGAASLPGSTSPCSFCTSDLTNHLTTM